MIGFALCQQLNIYKKSVFHNKLSTKPGNSWIITFIGNETDTPPEVDIKEGVFSEQESQSEKNDEEEKDDYIWTAAKVHSIRDISLLALLLSCTFIYAFLILSFFNSLN